MVNGEHQRSQNEGFCIWHVACSIFRDDSLKVVAELSRGWIVVGRRNSKRLSDVLRREYHVAMHLMNADFAGGERDYVSASEDFKRQPPLACDLYLAPSIVRHRSSTSMPPVTGVQAAPSMTSG